MRTLLFAALAASPALAQQAYRWPQDLTISLTEAAGGEWRLDYTLDIPARRLNLGPSLNGFRAEGWVVTTDGLAIVEENGRDYLTANNRTARFSEASIVIRPQANGFAKNYEPIKLLPKGGAILYTGHFWPRTEQGGRYDAVFNIRPLIGGHVSAFGYDKLQFEGWKSPTNHPAFVYAGPLQPVDIGGVSAVLDPAAPDWVRGDALVLAPRLIAFYAHAFGRGLAGKPDMFVTMGDDSEEGVLRYDGDALPGQFHISLSGGAWGEVTDEGLLLIRLAVAHELAHLWQERARPASESVPDWIHEGAADALAVEALVATGALPADAINVRLDGARAECGQLLLGGSLKGAEAAGKWRAAYACGHVLAVIAARAQGSYGSVADFWREFTERSAANGGYDEALFFAMVEEKRGRDFAMALARFPRTAYAAPEKELAALLERAVAP